MEWAGSCRMSDAWEATPLNPPSAFLDKRDDGVGETPAPIPTILLVRALIRQGKPHDTDAGFKCIAH